MKKTNIAIVYDGEKLATIKLYMVQRGASLEDEIIKTIDALYGKMVPANVREFLDLRSGTQTSAVKRKAPRAPLPGAPAAETRRGDLP